MRKVRRIAKGELNRIIDNLIHPYFRNYPALILVDGFLHALVEQDLDTSVKKFARYNIPKLLRHLARKQK